MANTTIATFLRTVSELEPGPRAYRFDFYRNLSPGKGVPVLSTTVNVKAGQVTTVTVLTDGGTTYRLLQSRVPPPAPTGLLRVRIINASAVTVTINLDNVAAPVLRPGQATTLLVTPPANIPNGHDTAQLTYPQTPPAGKPCTNVNTGATFQQRGHGYLMPVLSIVDGLLARAGPSPTDGSDVRPLLLERGKEPSWVSNHHLIDLVVRYAALA